MPEMKSLDQHLQRRGGRWHYIRRIPARFRKLDGRGTIRTALDTSSLQVARARRDAMVEADDQYWAHLAFQNEQRGTIEVSRQRYEAARTRGLFNEGKDFKADGSQFDRLFTDNEAFKIGSLDAQIIYVPGHTPACVAYLIGNAVFVGDTLFMPDYGSARCDFPGGDAGALYDSVQKLYQLPDATRMFLCHDYKSKTRNHHVWETTVGDQRSSNIHLNENTDRNAFISMRNARDKSLGMPKLILPSISRRKLPFISLR